MDEITEILSLFDMARVRTVTRSGERARMDLSLPDGGPPLALSFAGCTELTLAVPGGGAPIEDPAALTALRLQLLHAQIAPAAGIVVFAWAPGAPVRGGHLRVRASAAEVVDETGTKVARRDLVARFDVARRARAASFSATEYRKVFDRVLMRDVRPRLPGFHADRRSLLRAREGLVDIFETELGRWASPESLEITIKLHVLAGEVAPGAQADEVWGQATPAMALNLEPPYVLSGPIDEAELAARLVDDVERFVLPFFDRVHGPDDVVALLADEDRRRGDHLNAFALAELLARLGRLDEARAYYRVSPGVPDAIRRCAARHGISLDD
jgi:hypothetical protein